MRWLALLLCCSAALALPLPDEVDSDDTRKVLGSSVVTSVSVIMDLGNGTQAVFTDATGNPVEKPIAGGDVGSPVEMATPDHYQYYSFDGSGNLIKRYMTKDDVSSIIATNQKHNSEKKPDSPTFYHSMPANIGDLAFETTQDGEEEHDNLKQSQLRVHNVVASVQNLLKSQMSSQANLRPPMPTHISPDASASWSMILPSFFGNQASLEDKLNQASLPSEIQANSNDTELSTLLNFEESQHEPHVPVSHTLTSETNTEKLVPIASSSESTFINNFTESIAAVHLNENVQHSSESQMLGDAPQTSESSEDALSSEHYKETSETSKTEYEPVQSTESMENSETYAANKPEHEEVSQVIESLGNEHSSETLPEFSSTETEILSSTVYTETTKEPTQENSQSYDTSLAETSSDDNTSVLLTSEQNLSSQSSENHKLETVYGSQPTHLPVNEYISTTTTSEIPVPSLIHFSHDATMLADSPVDSIYDSYLSEEKVPFETSVNQNNSIEQTPSDSIQEQSNESTPSNSMGHTEHTEQNSHLSEEQSQSESVEDVKNSDSAENSDENSQYDDQEKDAANAGSSSEKFAIAEEHTTSDSKEHLDNVKEPMSTDSIENINNSVEKETSTEELENSKEESNSESVHINSEENSQSAESLVNIEEVSQSVEEGGSFTSDEQTSSTTPEKLETSPYKTHTESDDEASNLSTENMPSNDSSHERLEEQAQADAPHADKLGENSNLDLANTLVISDENHSSFNQVDMSSSSSKETVAAKHKNSSLSENVQGSIIEDKISNETNISTQSEDILSTISKIKDADNEYSESMFIPKKRNSTSVALPIDSDSLSSNEESNVSASPAETTDTSSSTPEVTEESDSGEEQNEEKHKGTIGILSEKDDKGEATGEPSSTLTTQSSSSFAFDELHTTHDMDESVASIVSQITNGNVDSKISNENSEESTNVEKNDSSDIISESPQGSAISTTDSQENPATEVIVTSVSTSKSTESSSANVDSSSKDSLKTDGSDFSNPCSIDSSCSDADNLDNIGGSPLDNDKISSGSESVEITTNLDNYNKIKENNSEQDLNESEINNSSDNANTNNLNLVQDIPKATDESSHQNEKLVTENPLESFGTHSSITKGDVIEGVVGVLTTVLTERTNSDTDSATPSTILTESGEIPISSEGAGFDDKKSNINENIILLPPGDTKKVCNKEGSGSDSPTDSCEENPDHNGSGSGSGLDSTEYPYEGSGDETTSSLKSEGLATKPGHTDETNTQKPSRTNIGSFTNEDEIHDIMKYASSIKDIGITSTPTFNEHNDSASNESMIPSKEDTLHIQHLDKLNENSGSASISDPNKNEFVIEKNMTNNDKLVDGHVMDLFEYINSNADIGITNSYNDSEIETTEDPSATEPNRSVTINEKINDDQTMDLFKYVNSDADIGITNSYNDSDMETTEDPSATEPNRSVTNNKEINEDQTMDLFKYVNSDADIGITNSYNDSESETTEESTATDSNDIESTTVLDEDTMMNDEPYSDTDAENSDESIIPYHINLLKDWSTQSNSDKADSTTNHKTLPQKAQKDDTINDAKLKPHLTTHTGGLRVSLEQESENSKVRNSSESEDTNWTKVEVISHLVNTTFTDQQTSTVKPSQESSHLDKSSVAESESAVTDDVSHSPLSNGRPQFHSPSPVELHPAPQESLGLEASTLNLVEDVQQFAELCNELAFKLWVSMTEKSVTSARSLVMSPFAVTSLLAMIFLGAKGSTSGQMNDMLKLDDMMTFNPHQVFRNVTESVVLMRNPGVRTAAFVRELYSDKSKGPLLDFYKQRASQFYDGLVEEANFTNIGDILRRRTNLQIKKQTGGRVPEYLRGASLSLQPPLAAFSANIFQTDCRGASTKGRDGEMYFTILPTTRQRRLVPIPSAVFRTGFLAGYEPGLDATVVSLGMQDSAISTLFVIPGQQGQTAPGDGLSRLEARLLATAYTNRAWSRLLRSLLPRPGMEVQIPRFSHRSLLNVTHSLQSMGLNDLFNPNIADLKGLSGFTTALHVSDLVQINTFTTCGEEVIGSRHHVEIYPSAPQRAGRDTSRDEQDLDNVPLISRPRQARVDLSLEPSGFEEAVPQEGIYSMPLALRPRQARLPDGEDSLPRLKFDRPFLYFVRHNPTGFILHMGRFNPRLLH